MHRGATHRVSRGEGLRRAVAGIPYDAHFLKPNP